MAASRDIMSPQQYSIGPESKPWARPAANARCSAATQRGSSWRLSARFASMMPAIHWCQRHTA
jgi:hypothetical protein